MAAITQPAGIPSNGVSFGFNCINIHIFSMYSNIFYNQNKTQPFYSLNNMSIPAHLIINADDFGYKSSVNKAILYCYENEIINSTSLMVNTPGFEEAVEMIHSNGIIKNVGVHVNLASESPLTDFRDKSYLRKDGKWNKQNTGRKTGYLSAQGKKSFFNEIEAQVLKAQKFDIKITHLDSHCHLHTLPALYPLFIEVACKNQLKLRLAQTYNENNYLKFLFRKFLNYQITKRSLNYSVLFESVDHFTGHNSPGKLRLNTEVMLHPDFDDSGNLTDHLLATDMSKIIDWLDKATFAKSLS